MLLVLLCHVCEVPQSHGFPTVHKPDLGHQSLDHLEFLHEAGLVHVNACPLSTVTFLAHSGITGDVLRLLHFLVIVPLSLHLF